MKKIQTIILVTIGVLMIALPTAEAKINVTPVRQEIELSRGEERQISYWVKNVSPDENLQVTVVPREWIKIEENMDISIKSWLKEVSPSKMTLAPGEKKEVVCSISVPNEAIGELSAMLSFRYKSVEKTAKKTMVNTALAVSLYVMIKGTGKVDAEITKMDLLYAEKALRANITVKNNGNVHLRPRGKVTIFDKKKKEVVIIELKYGWPVYPGKDKLYQGQKKGFVLKPGKYTMVADIRNNKPEFHIEKESRFKVTKKGIEIRK